MKKNKAFLDLRLHSLVNKSPLHPKFYLSAIFEVFGEATMVNHFLSKGGCLEQQEAVCPCSKGENASLSDKSKPPIDGHC